MYLPLSAPFDLTDDRSDFFQKLLERTLTHTGSLHRVTKKALVCKATTRKQKQPLNLHSNTEIRFNFLFFSRHDSLRWVQGAGRLRGNRSRYAEVSYDPGM